MNPRLPRVTAAQVIRVLDKIGFVLTRQSGSHKIYKNAVGRRVTVPFHAGKILHPKMLKSILADAGLTVEEFVQLLKDR
ncbi:type II toxin-antitoxin system HicA family toxin [Candidatus Poribacteria bacterium]|nr:type II toxin-antitoxin system HicA family toxin [Candidatus Poribacteria bacterium]